MVIHMDIAIMMSLDTTIIALATAHLMMPQHIRLINQSNILSLICDHSVRACLQNRCASTSSLLSVNRTHTWPSCNDNWVGTLGWVTAKNHRNQFHVHAQRMCSWNEPVWNLTTPVNYSIAESTNACTLRAAAAQRQ